MRKLEVPAADVYSLPVAQTVGASRHGSDVRIKITLVAADDGIAHVNAPMTVAQATDLLGKLTGAIAGMASLAADGGQSRIIKDVGVSALEQGSASTPSVLRIECATELGPLDLRISQSVVPRLAAMLTAHAKALGYM
jgi:hypothetical protein